MYRIAKNVVFVGAVALAALASANRAHAIAAVTSHEIGGLVTIGADQIPVDLVLDGSDDFHGHRSIHADRYNVSVDFSGSEDPFLSYAIGATNLTGAPVNFSFAFSTPIVPTGPNTIVNSSLAGALTDANGDGVSITPFGQPLIQSSTLSPGSVNMGVDVGPGSSFGPGTAGALYLYGPFTAGPIAGPVGIWNQLDVKTAFTLTGNGDAAALTGFVKIEDVSTTPEPASLALLGVGALGLIRRRRAPRA